MNNDFHHFSNSYFVTLKKIEGDKVAITEMMKVVVHNYSLYWECSAKVDGWQDWYNAQKKIYDEIAK